MPSHSAAPPPKLGVWSKNYLHSKTVHEHLLPAWNFGYLCISSAYTYACPWSLLCNSWLTTPFLKCFFTWLLRFLSWFDSCLAGCFYSVFCWFLLILLPSILRECPRAWSLDRFFIYNCFLGDLLQSDSLNKIHILIALKSASPACTSLVIFSHIFNQLNISTWYVINISDLTRSKPNSQFLLSDLLLQPTLSLLNSLASSLIAIFVSHSIHQQILSVLSSE